jgi:hypothetical protein
MASDELTDALHNFFQNLPPVRGAKIMGDLGGKIQGYAEPVMQMLGIEKPVDASWHDQMVRQANQSFQKKPAAPKPGAQLLGNP